MKDELFVLKRMVWPTLIVGSIAFASNLIYVSTPLSKLKLSTDLYLLLGLVLFLVAFFRIHAGYKNWEKIFNAIVDFNSNVYNLYLLTNTMKFDGQGKQGIYVCLRLLCDKVKRYLVAEDIVTVEEVQLVVKTRLSEIMKDFTEHRHRNRISEWELQSAREMCSKIIYSVETLRYHKATSELIPHGILIRLGVIALASLPMGMLFSAEGPYVGFIGIPVVMAIFYVLGCLDLQASTDQFMFHPVEEQIERIKRQIA